MPMVVMNDGVKESSLNRSRQHDLPTPESPIRRSLICRHHAISITVFAERNGIKLSRETVKAGKGV